MADVVLDLYAEDLDKDFAGQAQDEFGGDGVDLYDDIGGPTEAAAAGGGGGGTPSTDGAAGPGAGESAAGGTGGPNGVYHQTGGNLTPTMNRRYQLYVGNLTWWTTDQDIANALRDIGVNDLQEVKFFENRANGQSKGFSVISLGSESSLRSVLDQLPKVEMHGQAPVVTYPSKQALTQFESLQKTRPVPPPQQNGPPRGPAPPNMSGGPMASHPGGPQGGGPPGHPPRNMQPIMQPGQYRPQHMSQVPQVGGPNSGPPRMQPPMHPQGGLMGNQQPPPRYPSAQGQWPGQRPGGPRPGPPNGPPQRPMFQGAPMGMPVRGPPGPDWRRPPMHGGFPPQGPPRGLPPAPGPGGPHGAPAPHVNPAFFNQPGGPAQHPGMGGPPHGAPGPQPGMAMPPQQGMNMPPQHGPPPQFAQHGPRGPWPPQQGKPPGPFPDPQQMGPQLTEVEFEEVMSRNRTVSSSAIARAVSDAAAGEYSSAIETLVTAISLIKQSKVAHDERCKILISSLQDTLHGIEAKSYNRRERSRSRERSHRSRQRRERSTSRYRERSRDRERERERERERDGGYRERSRSRERERQAQDHYRDDSRSARPRKSPEPVVAEGAEPPSSKRYYEDRERYRSSDRERRDRDRDRERERERDRDRREEHRSRH
ncbi:cleavage and polyadenylation specificity factor subunit 6 isoform X1 [Drosophila bipectinata]|uniref:cleavage and polyadenylation specificity factor subunit 6 isoform X1 n=1 Tax=Drosophila bipectinata TaxID=42026 RepID=UPI001C8A92C2|nr:cleavage and polyadenylation specificity factor subunit 6 isoform X1 [Drosophila bipectinata]